MKKVLILYFSGAGAARKVAQCIHHCISLTCAADMCSFENADAIQMNRYDAFIIGTPVYHAAPACIVVDFFERMEPLVRETPAFLYNTRATWSCNTNRILAKKIKQRNIVTIMDRDYRSPASDGSLLAPFVRRFFEFDKKIDAKIERDCVFFTSLINRYDVDEKAYIPHFRISSILNAPNKLAGQLVTFRIYLHKSSCTHCGRCVAGCPHHARELDGDNYPTFSKHRCENCYRCIHHCPGKALSLSKRKTPGKQLDSL